MIYSLCVKEIYINNYKIMKAIIETIKVCTIEQLREIAIEYKDKFEVAELIIADKVNDLLIEKMEAGEFEIFCNECLI